MAFGCNELIELIMAFSRNELIKLNNVGPTKLIVKSFVQFSFGLFALAALQLIIFVSFGVVIIGLVKRNSIVGLNFLGLFALAALPPMNDLVGLLAMPWLKNLADSSALVDCWIIGLVLSSISGFGVLSLISINGIGSFKNHSLISLFIVAIISLIGSSTLVDCRIIVGFIGGFVGLSGLISNISIIGFVSLIRLLASSACWLIGFGGVAICSVAAIIAALANLSAVVRKQATRGVAAFFVVLCNSNHLAMAGATATCWLKQTASHGIAALQISASEIVNAATAFYAVSSLHIHSFVKEKMCWWLALA